MNSILVALSILAITALTYGATRVLRIPVCPICAGVSATWLGMLAAKTLGYAIDPALIALLMGGTVVGIAYQTERFLPAGRSLLLWKSLIIPTGFVTMYALLHEDYPALVASLAVLLGTAFAFLRPPRNEPVERAKRTDDLEERMKRCC